MHQAAVPVSVWYLLFQNDTLKSAQEEQSGIHGKKRLGVNFVAGPFPTLGHVKQPSRAEQLAVKRMARRD